MKAGNPNRHISTPNLTANKQRQVRLYTPFFRKKIKYFIYSFCTISISAILLFAIISQLRFRQFVPMIALSVALFGFFFLLAKNIHFTSLKGDMIIFKDFWGNSKITAIKSVKKVKTRCYPIFQLSTVHYTLDGKNCTSRVLSNCAKGDLFLDELITNYLVERKKKKANHKPGSVITQPA